MKWIPYEPMIYDRERRKKERYLAIRRIVTIIILMNFLISGVMLYTNQVKLPLFCVKSIQLVGLNFSNVEEVEKILNECYGTYLFEINSYQLENKLLKLDWIEKVVIKRQFPCGLRVEFEEEFPVASIIADRNYLMTNLGNFYPVNNVKLMIDLPVMTNYSKPIVAGKNRVGESMKKLAKILSTMKNFKIYSELVEIRFDEQNKPHFYLGNYETEWFIGSNWLESISATDAFIEQLKNKNQIANYQYIDAVTPGFISVLEKNHPSEGSQSVKL